jgi:hypothetical protein
MLATEEHHQWPARFEASTTTSMPFDSDPSWATLISHGSSSTMNTLPLHDGYIRPMSPSNFIISSNANIDDRDDRLPSTTTTTAAMRPVNQSSSKPLIIYRSSTTIYTKDKHRYVDGGEIRTWSVREHHAANDSNECSRKPATSMHIDRRYQHEQERSSTMTNDTSNYLHGIELNNDEYNSRHNGARSQVNEHERQRQYYSHDKNVSSMNVLDSNDRYFGETRTTKRDQLPI